MRAAQTGRILVCDEVDKAPLEVICVLKGLIGDGELVLHDGRRLLSMDRALLDYSRSVSLTSASLYWLTAPVTPSKATHSSGSVATSSPAT